MPGGHVCPEGDMHGWGGMHTRGCAWLGGHACHNHPPHALPSPSLILRDTVGQWAGGTHPTGMHSCYDSDSILLVILDQWGIMERSGSTTVFITKFIISFTQTQEYKNDSSRETNLVAIQKRCEQLTWWSRGVLNKVTLHLNGVQSLESIIIMPWCCFWDSSANTKRSLFYQEDHMNER